MPERTSRFFQEQLAKDEELSASLHLIDSEELKRRYEVSLEHEVPHISHIITWKMENSYHVMLLRRMCSRSDTSNRNASIFPV